MVASATASCQDREDSSSDAGAEAGTKAGAEAGSVAAAKADPAVRAIASSDAHKMLNFTPISELAIGYAAVRAVEHPPL